MKKLISMILCLSLCFGAISFTATAASDDPFDIAPADFVQQIGAGWNLGNTLENHSKAYASVYDQETAFVKIETSQEMIDLVADTGFNAVRIPVSWGPQTVKNSKGDYVVKTDLLKRIKTIAGWCFDNNMFVIVNMHHDDRDWLNISATGDAWEEVKKQYRQTWEQIATYFKDYDEKLILEGGNEILATAQADGCGTGTGYCWWGHGQSSFDKLNELYQIFVDTVRATGGNNDRRFLMLPTYGAQWYQNQISKLKIPNNDKHMLVDIHWYETANQMKPATVDSYAKTWCEYAEAYGFGVVMGECGFYESVASATKVSWANSYVNQVRGTYKIPVFLWDDGGDMRMMTRKQGQKIAWTSRSADYAKAVTSVSRKYIVNPDGSEPITYVLGDAKKDGVFNSMDIAYLRKQLAKTLDKPFEKGADANRDGVIDIRDLYKMRKVLAKLERF